jgi:hypothetical protein
MTALEKIEEIRKEYACPAETSDTFTIEFLLRAFETMREIARCKRGSWYRISLEEIDKKFNERMKQ